jgi:hypothetical protein
MTTEIQPPIHEVTSLSSMGAALEAWHGMVVADSPKTKEALSDSQGWVDVRDTALGHVLALEREAAGGQRIFTVAGTYYDILIYPVILTLI